MGSITSSVSVCEGVVKTCGLGSITSSASVCEGVDQDLWVGKHYIIYKCL